MGTVEQDEANRPAEEARQAVEQESPKKEPWWFRQPLPIDRFTGWLMVYTFLLFVATIFNAIILLKTDFTLYDTLMETKKSADAAKKSAELSEAALTRLERPYLFLDKMTITDVFLPDLPYLPRIQGVFTNAGKSPATLVECYFSTETTKIVERGIGPNLDRAFPCAFPGETIAAGQSSQLVQFPPQRLKEEVFKDFVVWLWQIILYGEFSYEDVFDNVHTEGFGFSVAVLTRQDFLTDLEFRDQPETIRRGSKLIPYFYKISDERYNYRKASQTKATFRSREKMRKDGAAPAQ